MSNNAEHVEEVRRLLASSPEGMTTQTLYDKGTSFVQRSDVAHALNYLKSIGVVKTVDEEGGRKHTLTDVAPAEAEPGVARQRGRSKKEEVVLVLQAAKEPLTTREIMDRSDMFNSTTDVSQAVHSARKAGLVMSEAVRLDGKVVNAHRLATAAERDAASALAAAKQPVKKKVSPNRGNAKPAPLQPAKAPTPPPSPLAPSALVGSARRVVDAYVTELQDEHLMQLIQLEREIADTTTGASV